MRGLGKQVRSRPARTLEGSLCRESSGRGAFEAKRPPRCRLQQRFPARQGFRKGLPMPAALLGFNRCRHQNQSEGYLLPDLVVLTRVEPKTVDFQVQEVCSGRQLS